MTAANRFLASVLAHCDRGGERTFARVVGRQGAEPISWADLGGDIVAFSTAYRARQLRSGGTVLIFLEHGRSLYGSFLGAMHAGLVPSFMPPRTIKQHPERYWSSHRTLIDRIEPVAIVATPDTADEMAAAGLVLDGIAIVPPDLAPAALSSPLPTADDDIGLLQHSSGTTGLKKGVRLQYGAIARQLDVYAEALALTPGDRIASWLPLYHDMGLIACFLLPAYHGLSIVQLDPFHWLSRPDTLFTEIAGDRATLSWLPNFAFDHLANVVGRRAASYDLTSMRAFVNCSEPCRATTFDRFAATFAPSGLRPEALQCCYAMAETVYAVTQTPPDAVPKRLRVDAARLSPGTDPIDPAGGIELLSSGPTVAGASVAILDEGGEPVADGTIGEIAIGADFLFDGYNADPERTAKRLRDGVYRSGDLGLVRDGEVYVVGRTDDMMIVNGRNMFAHEMEAVINRLPGVKPGRNLVFAQFDERSGSDAIFVIAEREAAADGTLVGVINDALQTDFAVQAKEVALVEPGWLIKTTSGKVSRAANVDKYRSMT